MTGIQVLPPDKSYEAELGQQLMGQGQINGPIYTPLAGAGKLAQTLMGRHLMQEAQDNQKQRQDAMTSNLQTMVAGATKPDGTLDQVALGKALMGDPNTAGMGLQMLTTAADNQAKVKAMPTGMRTLDPTDPKDAAMLKGLPAGSYQIDTNKGTDSYGKISPVGSQNPANQPDADPSQPLSPARESLAKMLVSGQMDPKSPMMRYIGVNEIARAHYLDPSFSMQDYPTQMKARQAFTAGGQYNKNLVALDTAAQHINLLKSYATAMQNGDMPSMNTISQAWQKQTGSALPTNFDAIKSTVAAEVAKANGEASLGALEEIQAPLNKSGSPAQLLGAIQGFQGLLAGKSNALKKEFVSDGLGTEDDFNKKFFTPEAQTMFSAQQQAASPPQAPQGALDALKANNTPQMQAFFKQKYGYLPP